MTLQRRLLVGFGSLWLVLLTASAVSIGIMNGSSRSLEAMFHENYDSVVYCDRIKESLDRLNETAQAALVGNPLPPDAILRDTQSALRQNITAQLNNCTLQGEDVLSRHLAAQVDTFLQAFPALLAAPPETRRARYDSDVAPPYRDARATAQKISDLNLDNMRRVDTRIKQSLANVRDSLLIFMVVGSTLVIACVAILANTLLHPIRALMASVRAVEKGNLDLNIPVRSGDELGELAAAFNSMASHLRDYRRLDADRLLRTQQTTQLAIDSLPDAVAVINPDARVEIANRTARQHFGLEPGKDLAALSLDWLTRLFQRTLESRQTAEPRGYEAAIQLFDRGEERFLLPRAEPIFDPQNKLIGVVIILVDITRLHKADELKSGLVATVSHELKTPLTSTRMAIHMLAQQGIGPLNEKQQRVVHAARQDMDRLQRTIDNLLNMSRIESGQRLLKLIPIPAARLVDLAVEPVRADFDRAQLRLDLAITADLPPVLADLTCIGHVLSNLLSNALKFTPPGGRVAITATRQPDGVAFTVTDSGPGIAPEHLSHLFEKFFRVPTDHGPPGAGLGLSIAREIVEAHGGRISATSSPGHGTSITFLLHSPAA